MFSRSAALMVLLLVAGPAHGGEASHRAWVTVRPFAGFEALQPPTGGALFDVGVEAIARNGFLIGFQLAPVGVFSFYYLPYVTARFQLGYGTPSLSISFDIGASLTFLYPQLGPTLRLGRRDRAHATLRLAFAVYPPRALPVDAELTIALPVHRMVMATFAAGAAYGNYYGAWGTLGAKVTLGQRAHPWYLDVGAGVGFIQYALGPLFQLGLERSW